MNIKQAITHSQIQRATGGILLLGGATFYFVSLLMALYRAALKMGESALLWQVGAMIQNLIANFYHLTAPYIDIVWRNVPTIDQTDPLTYSNLLFLGFVGVMIVGKQLILSGRRLRARIQRQIDRVEEMHWRNSLKNNRSTTVTTFSANTIGQINIFEQPMPSHLEDNWWNRPWGIVGLSIISGYIVAVIAKLTGML